jgi:hypothetical protein
LFRIRATITIIIIIIVVVVVVVVVAPLSTVNHVLYEQFSCLVGASDKWPCHRVGKSHLLNAFPV